MNISRSQAVALCLALVVGAACGACQERSGSCPALTNVDPVQIVPGVPTLEDLNPPPDPIQVDGRNFALGHNDLWDEGGAEPPEVWLVLQESTLVPAEVAGMELPAEAVTFESSQRLIVTPPILRWADMVSAAEMSGMYIPELPAGTEIELTMGVRVENASGCAASWDGTLIYPLTAE